MSRLTRILSKLNHLFRNNRAEEELAREVTSHLTLLADDFERRGMSPEEARLAAKRAYGGVEQAKQAHRDERSLLWIEQTIQDLRNLSERSAAELENGKNLLPENPPRLEGGRLSHPSAGWFQPGRDQHRLRSNSPSKPRNLIECMNP